MMMALLPIGEAAEDRASGRYHQAYILVPDLSEEHFRDDLPDKLLTPQNTMEFFLAAAEAEDFAQASLALNLRRHLAQPGDAEAARLAKRLHYILLQRGLIDWRSLSDRRDGQSAMHLSVGEQDVVGQPRRSIRLGVVEDHARPHSFSLHRIKASERPALWLFTASTVDAIDRVYEHHGPGWLEPYMPAWSRQRGPWSTHLWQWLGMAVFLGLAVLSGITIYRLLSLLLKKAPISRPWIGDLLTRIERPMAALIGLIVFYVLVRSALTLTGPLSSHIDLGLVLAVIVVVTWVATRVINFATDHFAHELQRKIEDGGDPRLNRTISVVSIVRQVLTCAAIAVALGVALQEMQLFRTIGIALLASAGAIGALFAIASGAVLGNLVAGLQVAITRPLDIGDTVVVEGSYGWVEEITYAYLVVRTWERRRLIVPLRHFIQNPFENLTKNDTCLIRSVRLHVDYRVDVQELRETFARLVHEHPDYDGSVEPKLIVIDAGENSLEIQGYVSAGDPSSCWFMHCDIREQMNTHICRLEDGLHLPRGRIQILQTGAAPQQPEPEADAIKSGTDSENGPTGAEKRAVGTGGD